MTASQQAKSLGLISLKQVADMCGHKNTVNLTNWHKNKPKQFEIVLLGCAKKIEQTKA